MKAQPLYCGFGQEGQGPELFEFITLLKYQLLIGFYKSDTSGSRPKVPFAVTRHIYRSRTDLPVKLEPVKI